MWKSALVGAMALAAMSIFSVSSDGIGIASAAAEGVVVTEAKIARLKSALRLTPAQESHWRSVEASLRAHLSQVGDEVADGGVVQRARARLARWTLSATAMHRIRSAAQPLISTLDEAQKRSGMAAIRAMGVAALF
jgi:hypothetical protein